MSGPYSLSPATTRINLDVTAGDLFDLIVPILDDLDAPVTISADNVADWSARATVRRNSLAAALLHEWSTSGDTPNAFIIAGTPAKVRLVATPAATTAWQAWPDFTCGWDLDVTEPDRGPGDIDGGPTPCRIAAGRFRLHPQYTR